MVCYWHNLTGDEVEYCYRIDVFWERKNRKSNGCQGLYISAFILVGLAKKGA